MYEAITSGITRLRYHSPITATGMFNVKSRCIKFIKLLSRAFIIKSPQSGQGKLSLAILKIRGKGYLMRSFGPAYVKAGRGEVEGKEYVITVNGLLEQKFISWLCQCTNLKVNRVLTCKVL